MIYCLGVFIGQDIWQRVFTARSTKVAKIGGITAGVYCIIWCITGALIGMAARVFLPELSNPDATFTSTVQEVLPVGVRGFVLAAALAALMSTASACMMATSTIGVYDLYAHFIGKDKCTMKTDRCAILLTGVIMLVISSAIGNVIAALTVAYNLLVGALLIPLIGAIAWRKASSTGAIWAILLSSITIVFFMVNDGLLANSPIYYGLSISFVTFVAGSFIRPDPV